MGRLVFLGGHSSLPASGPTDTSFSSAPRSRPTRGPRPWGAVAVHSGSQLRFRFGAATSAGREHPKAPRGTGWPPCRGGGASPLTAAQAAQSLVRVWPPTSNCAAGPHRAQALTWKTKQQGSRPAGGSWATMRLWVIRRPHRAADNTRARYQSPPGVTTILGWPPGGAASGPRQGQCLIPPGVGDLCASFEVGQRLGLAGMLPSPLFWTALLSEP
mmetsp:Transcript_35247/g.78984  ORF Transcript_35247/g.78984 Transcript_35247/m.78984 type:complete len:215 (-) Transcript_35247:27-671(-)